MRTIIGLFSHFVCVCVCVCMQQLTAAPSPLPGMHSLNKCLLIKIIGLPRWHTGEEPTFPCRRCKEMQVWSPPWKIPQRRKWQPTPVFLLGNFHGQRNLVGFSPWGLKRVELTEQLSTYAIKIIVIALNRWSFSTWGSQNPYSKLL